jgi:hypothetical protein
MRSGVVWSILRRRVRFTWIQELLCGLALHFLRSYDFLTACRVLRAIAYLGLDDGADFKACLSFLRLHQRPNGAFGFFGLEEAPLKAQGVDGLALDARLYLPVTTACLLALCEGSGQPTWWLYNALSDGMKSPHPIFP